MKVRTILGIALASPVTLVTLLFYVLPFAAMGWYRYLGWFGDGTGKLENPKSPFGAAPVWVVQRDRCPGWLQRYWTPWAGHCVGTAVVVRDEPGTSKKADAILTHELHHAHQLHRFGAVQVFLYAMSSLAALAADEDGYSMNAFEMASRRMAGQIVDPQSFLQGYQVGRGQAPTAQAPK